ncbi:MAG: hypothetical protein VKL42_00790, partial [Snowella sp.]|nr:hypothetical protein [Snowella sp.]
MSLIELYHNLSGRTEIPLTQSGLGKEGETLLPLLSELSDTEVTLVISQGPTWEDPNQSKFTIKGTPKRSLLGMDAPVIQLMAELDGNTIQFQMQIETTVDWTLGTSFPKLKNTEFNWLSFSPVPRFILTTKDIPGQKLVQGLNFQGNLRVTNALIALLEFIPEVTDLLPVVGTIISNQNYQVISLKAQATDTNPSLDLPGLLTFHFLRPEFALYAYIYRENQAVALFKTIESDVTLTGRAGTNSVTIPLALQLPTLVTGWQMMLQPGKEASLANFLEFLSLLASAGQFDLMDLFSDPSEKLNEVRTILQSLALKSFYVEITGSLNKSPQFRSFSFDIQSKGTLWKIIEDKLTLTNLRVFVNVAKKETVYTKSGFIQGEVEIAKDIAINALIPLPTSAANWRFSSHHPIVLSDIKCLSKYVDNNPVGELLPSSLGDIGGLELSELSLVYDPNAVQIKTLEFAVKTDHPWIIVQDKFELVSLFLRFTIEKGSSGWGLSGNIQGELLAGGINIDTQLQKPTPDSDWYFALHANNVPLPNLESLGRLTGRENALADALPDSLLTAQLYLNDPRLEFNLSQRQLESFGFSLVTDEIDFTDIKIIRVGLDVDIVFPSQRNIKIYGLFTISDLDFFVEGDYSESEGWQFLGQAALEKPIDIGKLIEKLAAEFNFATDLPKILEGLTLSNIEISFKTQTKNFTFSLETQFPIDGKQLATVIHIEITHESGKYTKNFGGIIKVNYLEFDLIFSQEKSSDTILLATYKNEAGKDQNLRAILELITNDADMLNVAEGISLNIKYAVLVIDKGNETKILFGLDIGTDINLSNLPLVGKEFPKEQTIGVDNLQFLIANKDFTPSEITTFNKLLKQGTKIPIKDSTANAYGAAEQIALPKGLNVAAKMQFGSQTNILALPISSSTPQTPTPSQPTVIPSTTTPPSDNATWFKIQKSFGPVHFERVGVQYKDAAIGFLLDASGLFQLIWCNRFSRFLLLKHRIKMFQLDPSIAGRKRPYYCR